MLGWDVKLEGCRLPPQPASEALKALKLTTSIHSCSCPFIHRTPASASRELEQQIAHTMGMIRFVF